MSSNQVQYLFNSLGEYIAYKVDGYIFNENHTWIAWVPNNGDEVYSKMGEYLATIVDNRLYEFSRRDFQPHPGYPDFPGHYGAIDYPPFEGASSIPPFASDVQITDWEF